MFIDFLYRTTFLLFFNDINLPCITFFLSTSLILTFSARENNVWEFIFLYKILERGKNRIKRKIKEQIK